jgi:hypothetical protein
VRPLASGSRQGERDDHPAEQGEDPHREIQRTTLLSASPAYKVSRETEEIRVENFSSFPPEEERELVVYEARMKADERTAKLLGIGVAVGFGALFLIVILAFWRPQKSIIGEDPVPAAERTTTTTSAPAETAPPPPSPAAADTAPAPAETAPTQPAPAPAPQQ